MTLETLVETQTLRIRYRRGHSRTLLVSFTGIGHRLAAMPPEEFVGSGIQHHALFVSDLCRSWYNTEGIADTIVSVVRDTRLECRATKTATLGNSMGAFGAILFARLLDAHAAIAFAPQFSISPKIAPWETRWHEYRDKITHWHYPTALPLSPRARYFIFAGDDRAEAEHLNLFPNAPNVAKFKISGYHDVARDVKAAGLLHPIIGDCLRWPMPIGSRLIKWRLTSLMAQQ